MNVNSLMLNPVAKIRIYRIGIFTYFITNIDTEHKTSKCKILPWEVY